MRPTGITVQNFYASYGDTPIVKGVSLCLAAGEIVALIGSNGSGKSTLLRGLMGLVPFRSGVCRVNDVDALACGPSDMTRLGFAYVPQRRETFTEMTVKENLVVGTIRFKRFEREEKIAKTLEIIPELRDILDRKVGALSVGMRRLVAFGRAVVPDPQVLLLDEPLAGLSAKLGQSVMDLLGRFRNKGISILAVEHKISTILMHSDRVYGLRAGEIFFDGKPEQLIFDKTLLNRLMNFHPTSR